MSKPRILMCPPDFFGIEYEINPWMNVEVNADHSLAKEQWNGLVETLKHCGAEIEIMESVKGLPDLVFTANAGMMFHNQVILSRFHYPQRQGEEEYFADWFEKHDFRIIRLDRGCFEGAGDALFCGETLFAGYMHRSDINAHHEIAERYNIRVLGMELVDARFYHLDTCFCPLKPGTAIAFLPAFDPYGQDVLRNHVNELIEVQEPDAVHFGCNAVVIGNKIVMNTGTDGLKKTLEEKGWEVFQTPLSEFLKAGGAAKCLTLRLDGEEAARW